MSAMSALLSSLLILISMATLSLSFQFNVGGNKGWIKPPANNTNAYNNWASLTRFQIGDTLYFRYMNDSVLVVNEPHYNSCNVNNPISKHVDGKTVIELDHDGYFYFISGKTEHCISGQKLIVDVLADRYDTPSSPSPAPSSVSSSNKPSGGPSNGGGGGRESAADKSSVSSAVLSFVVFVLVYMFL